MNDREFLADYFDRYRNLLFDRDAIDKMIAMRDVLRAASEAGGKIIFAGNGASAAIASHCAVDFTKQGGLRSVTFNESDLITCLANDYGYESWIEKALEYWADPGDVLVLISSSGRSPNVVNAARHWKGVGNALVTLTGFEPDNPLAAAGDINFWVNSRAYNVIECVHQVWLMAVCDLLVGKAEYPVS